jgi:dienelactone hydrolase
MKAQQPLYFPSGEPRLFGWLHRPTGAAASGWGVVICKPFGYEAQCGHRSMRAFADAAAELGIPVLRFDYLGTGDSADIDPTADQAEVWTRDITNAVAELRRLTGVSRVCLLGFRLGALLAVLAGRECQVDAVALVAPVLSGKRYLREARTLQLAGTGAALPDAGPDGMEVNGYTLSEATLASLSRLDVSGTPPSPASHVLVVDRIDLPAARGWAQLLRDAGGVAEYHALRGFVEMMWTTPDFAKVPQEMLRATREWLLRLRDQTSSAAPAAERTDDRAPAPASELILPGESPGSDACITERGMSLGRDEAVFGVLTTPHRDESRRRAVILLNVGADHHVGASRAYVSLARRWARRGYFVLRMDLAGLGDSHTRAGRRENDVFPAEALEDIRAAIDFMVGRYGIRETSLVGVCSGAYHALRAAVAGLPLHRVLMVNPQHYFWDPSMALDGLQLVEVVRNPGIYRERIFSASAWRRVLTGQVNIWRIVKIYPHRLRLALQSKLRDAARAVGIRLPRDLGRELEAVSGRGIRVVFVFARGEAGLELLRIEAGSMLRRLGERCRVRIIDSADHTFSRSGPRRVLEDVLSDELYARQESQPVADAGDDSPELPLVPEEH